MTDTIRNLKAMMDGDQIQPVLKVLDDVEHWPEADQSAVIEMLALASEIQAQSLISSLLSRIDTDHPFHSRLFQLAVDRAHVNYCFAPLILEHSGTDRLRQILPVLKHILNKETQSSLLNRIIRLAGKLKIVPLADELAEFIFFDDPDLKREAVKALERMGTPKALDCLERAAGTDKCDQDITDAIDVIKDNLSAHGPAPVPLPDIPAAGRNRRQISPHVAGLTAEGLKERIDAFNFFSTRGSQVAELIHENMDRQNPALMIHLLALAAVTIPRQAMDDLLTLASCKDAENHIKFSVYTALEKYPELESAVAVISGATDASMYVRMAAVMTLDRHCSDYIVAELKKRIESGTKAGQAMAMTILDARAFDLIDALMNSDSFTYICSNYLKKGVPDPILDTFIRVLEKRGRTSSVKKYNRLKAEETTAGNADFVVIHPDVAARRVYAKLIHGAGFQSQICATPQGAFESIMSHKPRALICDLFTPQMTITTLAAEVRELYTMQELPIIASSLHQGLDPKQLDQQLCNAGINGFCGFPPKPGQVRSWSTLSAPGSRA